MNKISLIALTMVVVMPNNVHAALCSINGGTSQTGACANALGGSIRITNNIACKTYVYTCHGVGDGTGTKVEHCGSCNDGYKTSVVTVSDSFCSGISQTVCIKDESESGSGSGSSELCDATTCAADNDKWANHVTGVQVQTIKGCTSGRCKTVYVRYRCAPMFYGVPDASTVCDPCPSLSGSTTRGLSAAGATKVTDCYWPSGGGGSDLSGTFRFTDNCYYSE